MAIRQCHACPRAKHGHLDLDGRLSSASSACAQLLTFYLVDEVESDLSTAILQAMANRVTTV